MSPKIEKTNNKVEVMEIGQIYSGLSGPLNLTKPFSAAGYMNGGKVDGILNCKQMFTLLDSKIVGKVINWQILFIESNKPTIAWLRLSRKNVVSRLIKHNE